MKHTGLELSLNLKIEPAIEEKIKAHVNKNGQSEKLEISFYAEKQNNDPIRTRFANVLVVKNKTTGNRVLTLSRNGFVKPENYAREIIPVISLFIRSGNDFTKAIIHYGLQTGECSIWGRELTDDKSIRLGIGAVCATYL